MSDRCAVAAEPKTSGAVQVSVAVTFLVHALLFASWTAHIPQIKAELRLSDGALGTALLGAPIGSVLAMVASGALLPRLGSRRMIRVSVVGYAIGGVAVGLADSPVLLFGALAVWGLFQGALDVAMNTQAVTVERAAGTAIMARLHGLWSIGGFLGALIGAGAVAAGLGLTAQLFVLGVVAVAVIGWLSRAMLADGARPRGTRPPRRSRLSPLVAILGGIAFASMLCEGAAADWSANYLRDDLGAGPALGGLGYAAYALAMVAVRLGGTILERRFRIDRLLPALSTVFALGMTTALLVAQPIPALLGFAAMGIGLALIVPSAFSAAGRADPGPNSGSAIATVSALGWLGYVSGPPLIGHLADRVGLGTALWTLPLLALAITAIARFGGVFTQNR
ncbi:MFS transporter [Nocardia terpenica]|uniref:MFS transporter n=1 Tax=Nocardia terpenica TaxID=455432 RepID=A0A161XHE3_9NOCA|nr:MFS transporter [Nocardia terpenica]KZM72968.1 MFS transporter [Nocardia terpenica]